MKRLMLMLSAIAFVASVRSYLKVDSRTAEKLLMNSRYGKNKRSDSISVIMDEVSPYPPYHILPLHYHSVFLYDNDPANSQEKQPL